MAMTEWAACERRLLDGIDTSGVAVGPGVPAQLIAYLKELAAWNRTYNLTAVRDPLEMVTRHLLDSLVVTDFVVGRRVADVGSGPGLPGLVLAIARSDLSVTLIEANGKKAAFLRHVRRRFKLTNVEVVQERVEAYQPDQRYDCVICRAFAAADECARLAGHLIAAGGRFLLMKGRDPGPELANLALDFRHVDTVALDVPGLQAQRHLAILEPGLI